MNHAMIDFETLGQQPDAAVISLGCVLFDREKITDEKLWLFNLDGQLDFGRRAVNASTIIWWMGQGEKARSVFEKISLEGVRLQVWAQEFLEFIKRQGPDVRIWANDTGFDTSIAENILFRLGHPFPWRLWNRRCYRTMKACFGIDPAGTQGVKHDALDDSKHQANCLIKYWATNPGAEK